MAVLFIIIVSLFGIGSIPVKMEKERVNRECQKIYMDSLSFTSEEISKLKTYHEKEANQGSEYSKFFLHCLEGYCD